MDYKILAALGVYVLLSMIEKDDDSHSEKPKPPKKNEGKKKPPLKVKEEVPELPIEIPVNKTLIPFKKDGYTDKFFDLTYVNDSWEAKADYIVDRIFENRERYEEVASRLNLVPWYIIAIIHSLESDLDFSKHLHNGDPLTGKTHRVPSGRPITGSPPFTWEESAIDAIKMKNWHNWVDWTIKDVLYRLEVYNGKGYMNRGKLSPYVWSGSNHGIGTGKYVSDGRYDPNAVSKQVGGGLLLRKIFERMGYELEKIKPTDKTKKIEYRTHESRLAELFDERDIKYFKPKEFLTMGGSHESGKCRNSLPPMNMLEDIADVAKMWDEVREYWGKPIVVNSVYRSEAYNKCVGGASRSYHKKGMAADCSPLNGDVSSLARAIQQMKENGRIKGGWGVYSTFVHLDIRDHEVKFR